MILDPNTLFKSTKDTKALLKVSIFILTAHTSSAHQKTEQPKYGTVKRGDFNIPFSHTQTQRSSADKATTLSREGLIR
jgi:hypothetical protein